MTYSEYPLIYGAITISVVSRFFIQSYSYTPSVLKPRHCLRAVAGKGDRFWAKIANSGLWSLI